MAVHRHEWRRYCQQINKLCKTILDRCLWKSCPKKCCSWKVFIAQILDLKFWTLSLYWRSCSISTLKRLLSMFSLHCIAYLLLPACHCGIRWKVIQQIETYKKCPLKHNETSTIERYNYSWHWEPAGSLTWLFWMHFIVCFKKSKKDGFIDACAR